MPQINQLSDIFFASSSGWRWCSASSTWIGRGMVPKIQSVVDDRDRKIADDLAAAQRAREEAEAAEEAYRERIDLSRSEAMKVAQEAKHQGRPRYGEAPEGRQRQDRQAGRGGRREDPRRRRRRSSRARAGRCRSGKRAGR